MVTELAREIDNGCRTPTSREHKIPERGPPAPPRKRRRVTAAPCKRRSSEIEFFRVDPDEIESFFLNLEEGNKKKQRKVVEVESKD
ncbi:hypothetical protein QJS10_CPB18g01726 [Acorus calamus]|uniref:Uncharacterized protein n=1 Tax=Acorus calamus TaxID=4465 RepID=A0AAV9CNZ2_ACOCL|nr:hypothetical protein QJS10_CPB18g01726 [Acorus calamus]